MTFEERFRERAEALVINATRGDDVIAQGGDRKDAVVEAVIQGTDAVVRDPLEVQQLVGLELFLDQQQGGKREAQADNGGQPDSAVLCS